MQGWIIGHVVLRQSRVSLVMPKVISRLSTSLISVNERDTGAAIDNLPGVSFDLLLKFDACLLRDRLPALRNFPLEPVQLCRSETRRFEADIT